MAHQVNDLNIERTQTLDTMLHQILNQALVAVEAEAGSLMLVDNKQDILQIKARLGRPRPGRKTERVFTITDNSIASWVVRNKTSYLCGDIESHPFFEPSRSGKNFSSLLSVPIIHADKVLAVINADASEKNYFTEEHKQKLEQVAQQVSGPIAERISILAALAEIGVELTRLPREGGVERALERIAELAVRSLGADAVTVYQYIQDKDEFPVEGTGPTTAGIIGDPHPMRRKVYPGDVPWTVVKQRRSGFYADVREQDFLTSEVHRPDDKPRPRFIEREGIKSMAALLLPFRAAELRDEEVVGVMFANYRTYHQFNIDEIAALATFADYAAAAILNARHVEQWHAEQMKMVESISANFAHRMSNLAGTSRIATQLLREHIDPADELALRQLDRIDREARILLELSERLARPFKETGTMIKLAPINIIAILEEELEHIKHDTKHVEVTKDFMPNLPKVQSVDFQLRQVVRDIINNAVEAMKDQEAGKLALRARLNRQKHRLEVEISDNGPGIRDDIRDRLFAPGVTSKKEKLGIGLWWCRTFMQVTGGDVVLKDTRSGEGATFLLELPTLDEAAEAAATKLVAHEKKAVDILIVDDRQRWREQLIDIMAAERYTIETASNFAEASHALEVHRFRLAILDISLVDADQTNEDGLRLLANIDKANLDTNVIIVTSHSTTEREETARRSPRLLAFIEKHEFDMTRFRELVRQTVRSEARPS